MPIMAAQPILYNQIRSILSMGLAAKQQMFSAGLTAALVSAAPMGLFPVGFAMIPLPPVGAAACQNLINQAMSLGMAANVKTVSTLIATGISLLVPLVPPAGLSMLQNQIEQAMSMDIAAQQDTVALILSLAIPNYFMAGGVV